MYYIIITEKKLDLTSASHYSFNYHPIVNIGKSLPINEQLRNKKRNKCLVQSCTVNLGDDIPGLLSVGGPRIFPNMPLVH